MHIVIVMPEVEQHLEVNPTETILELKQKLEPLLGIPARRQSLFFDEMELTDLPDSETLELLHVKEDTHLILYINSDENIFQIVVKLAGTEIHLEVEEMDTVASLKEKIDENFGPTEQLIEVFYQGTEMRDHQCLCEYKLAKYSEIIATFKSATSKNTKSHSIMKKSRSRRMMPPPKRLKFVVTTPNSLSITLEMTGGRTVGDLRKHLLDKDHLPQGDYFFIHNHNIMEDNESILSQGVQDGDFIDAFQESVS